MNKLTLHPISKIDHLTKETFQERYVFQNKPVIITDFSKNWPAREKWSFDYFKEKAGHVKVPIYAEGFADTGQDYLTPKKIMSFSDYLDLIISQPTQYRMFLFNIFKHIPELCRDFDYPDFVPYFLKNFPFMFFGGEGSKVDVHYDVDLSHVFLTQFQGRRRVILFEPNASTFLYRHPFTVSTNVDISSPDITRYPNLKYLTGYECVLQPGETLFMPSGYWHYIYYLNGGFGLSLRALPNSQFRRLHGLWNIFKLKILDAKISKLLGNKRWYTLKEHIAIRRANKLERRISKFGN